MYYISISMYIILYILFPPFCNAHINIQEQIFIYPIWNQVSHETWPMGGGGRGSVRAHTHTQLRSGAWAVRTWPRTSAADDPSVSKSVFTITEKAPTRAFPWLKAVGAFSVITSGPYFEALLSCHQPGAVSPCSMSATSWPAFLRILLMEETEGMEAGSQTRWASSCSRISQANTAGFSVFSRMMRFTTLGVATC